VREAHDACRQPFLVAVELADLNLGSKFAMGDIEPSERDGLVQDRRAGSTGDDAHLGTTDMHAVSVADRFVALHFEADQFSLRVFAPPQ
jgi:hypothetical protein